MGETLTQVSGLQCGREVKRACDRKGHPARHARLRASATVQADRSCQVGRYRSTSSAIVGWASVTAE
jgi:hypothetical protein